MLLWPFPQLALVGLMHAAWGEPRGVEGRAALAVICLLPLAFNLSALGVFRRGVERTRGGRMFASAAGDFANWVVRRQAERPGNVLICGNPVDAPLAVHSGGKGWCRYPSYLRALAPDDIAERLARGDLLWTSPRMDMQGRTMTSPELAELERFIPHELLASFPDAAGVPWIQVFGARTRNAKALRPQVELLMKALQLRRRGQPAS